MTKHIHRRCTVGRGFSLIELLVSMVIGLVVTLAISRVMITFEGTRRTSTAVNDVNQTGTYTGYTLDRILRNAGAGYTQRWTDVFGCKLNAVKGGTTVLPHTTGAFPLAFAGASITRYLAPVLIEPSAADVTTPSAQVRGDVLTVMAGTGGVSESPPHVQTASVTNSDLRLTNTLGFRDGDLILLVDSAVPAGCIVEQVNAGFAGSSSQLLPFGGSYFNATGNTVSLSNFSASGTALLAQIGNVQSVNSAPMNPPQFLMFAVGDNNTLTSFDLLQTGALDEVLTVADGVVEMRALYGIDTNGDGILDTWQNPTGTYSYANLTTGAGKANLRNIVAIRIGLILRSSLLEKDPVTSTTNPIVLFGDLDSTLQKTRTVSSTDQYYRFRTVEMTVPLRNMMFLP